MLRGFILEPMPQSLTSNSFATPLLAVYVVKTVSLQALTLRKSGRLIRSMLRRVILCGGILQDQYLSTLGYEFKTDFSPGDILNHSEVMAAICGDQGCPSFSVAGVQGFIPYKGQSSRDELEQTIHSIRNTQALPNTSPSYKKQLEAAIAHPKMEDLVM